MNTENFYRKIRKRSQDSPRLLTAIIAVFYFCMGMGFTGIRYESNFTIFISCLICAYMASLVYAIVEGKVVKALLNCVLFFALGALLKYMAAFSVLSVMDFALAFGLFVVFFVLGLLLGYVWYDKYIGNH